MLPDFVRAETMTMTMMLLLLLKLAVGLIIFAIGLDSTASDTIRLLRRPRFARLPDFGSVDVALVLAKSFFVPLLAGMAIRWLFPAFAKSLASRLMAIAGLALTLSAVVLLGLHWQIVVSVKGDGILALAALIVVALAIGHFLGGPAEDDRSVLAVACATRHIGIAVLVAASLPGPRTAVIIAVYIVTSAAISFPYIRWRRAVAARKPTTSPAVE